MRNITSNIGRNNQQSTAFDKENITIQTPLHSFNRSSNSNNSISYRSNISNSSSVTIKHPLTASSPIEQSKKKVKRISLSLSECTCGTKEGGGHTPPRFRSINTISSSSIPSSGTNKSNSSEGQKKVMRLQKTMVPRTPSKKIEVKATQVEAIQKSPQKPSSPSPPSPKSHHNNNDEKNEEDFSFAKLKGAVQKFERHQKEHYNKINHHSHSSTSLQNNSTLNTSIASLGLTSASSFGTHDSANSSCSGGSSSSSSTISSVLVSNFMDESSSTRTTKTTSFKSKSNRGQGSYNAFSTPPRKKSSSNGHDNQTNNNTATPSGGNADGENEDFSFQKLKQKALGMEKAAGGNHIPNGLLVLDKSGRKHQHQEQVQSPSEASEDFSFQKLKEKALQGPTTPIPLRKVNTPNRSKSRNGEYSNIVAPHTICGKTRRPLVPKTSHVYSSSSSLSTPSSVTTYKRSNSTPKKRMPSSSLTTNIGEEGAGSKVIVPSTETKKSTFNPNKFQFKPKIKKEEVQATNDTIASVSKLSQWLSDDPFDKKKQVLIRKGEQIANKSKAFEHEELVNGKGKMNRESRAQRERQYFPEGKVSQNKDWLQNAFGDGSSVVGNENDDPELLGVLEKRRILESAFKKNIR